MADKYTPYPTVEPKMVATPSIRETFPEVHQFNAVGEALKIIGQGTGTLGHAYEAVGDSFRRLGDTTRHAGGELLERAMALKQLEIDKQVDDAVLKNHMEQGKNAEEFGTLTGEKASPEAYQAAMKKGAAARQAIEDSLPSEAAKRQYRHQSMGSMGSEFRSMAKHAWAEQKGTQIKSAEAQVTMYKDQAGKADNDTDFNTAIKEGKKKVEKLRDIRGYSKEQTDLEMGKFTSDAYANRAKEMSRSDSIGAMEFLKKNRDKITDPEVWRMAVGTVSGALIDSVGRNEAQKAHSGNPDKPTEEKVKEARKGAEAGAEAVKAPELKEKMAEEAEARVRKMDGLYRQDKKRSEDDNRHSVASMIMGDNPKGKKLNSKEELFELGDEVKAAWEKGDYEDRMYWNKMLNSTAEHPPNDRLFAQLMGVLKYGTDAEQEAAKSWKVWDTPLSPAQQKDLHLEQAKLMKKGREAVENPDAHKLYNWGVDEGMISGIKKGTPEYARYMQTLDVALREITKKEGRELTHEEKKDIIRRINRGSTIGREEDPQPQAIATQRVPQDIVDEARKSFPNMTDDEIRRHWLTYLIEHQWETLFATGKATTTTKAQAEQKPPTKPMPKPSLLTPKEF